MTAFIIDNGSDPFSPIGDIDTRPPAQRLISLIPYFDYFADITVPGPPAIFMSRPGDRPLCLDDKLAAIPLGMMHAKKYPPNCLYIDALHDMRKWLENGYEGIDGQNTFVSPRFVEKSASLEFVLTMNIFPGIPTPSNDTSIYKVLNFNEKYKDERREFWSAIFDIVDNFDYDFQANKEINVRKSISSAIEEFENISRDSWSKRVLAQSQIRFVPTTAAVMTILASLAASGGIDAGIIHLPVDEIKNNLATFGWTGAVLGTIRCFDIQINLLPSRPAIGQRAQAMSYTQKVKYI